jgi:hypothetical protein
VLSTTYNTPLELWNGKIHNLSIVHILGCGFFIELMFMCSRPSSIDLIPRVSCALFTNIVIETKAQALFYLDHEMMIPKKIIINCDVLLGSSMVELSKKKSLTKYLIQPLNWTCP